VDVYWSIVIQSVSDSGVTHHQPQTPTPETLSTTVRQLHPAWSPGEAHRFVQLWARVPSATSIAPWTHLLGRQRLPLPGIGIGETAVEPLSPIATMKMNDWRLANPDALSVRTFDTVRKGSAPKVSFGLWRSLTEEFTDKNGTKRPSFTWINTWIPEVNVVSSYVPGDDFLALDEAMCEFASVMQQCYVWFVVDGTQHFAYERDTGRVERQPVPVEWRLHLTNSEGATDWIAMFQAIYATIYGPTRTTNRGPFVQKMFTMWDQAPNIRHVGATIEPGADAATLVVKISGYASYFFEEFFQTDVGENNPDAGILIECDGNNDDGYTVTYGRYAPDPGSARCLCGFDYPRGTELVGQSSLRKNSHAWIAQEYANGVDRAQGVPWGTLSSPYFYYTNNHAAFVGADHDQRAATVDEALREADVDWETKVLGGWFYGNP